MPVLDLPKDKRGRWPALIRAVMYDPDPGRADDFVRAMSKEHLVSLAQRHLHDPVMRQILMPGMIDLAESRNVDDLLQETESRHRSGDLWRGHVSGLALLFTLSRAKEGNPKSSLNDTFTELARIIHEGRMI